MRFRFTDKFKGISPLRLKLVTISLLLLAIPSLIIGTVGFYIAKSELDKSGRIQLKNDVRLVISMIDVLAKEVQTGHLKLEDAQESVKQQILGPKNSEGKRPISKRFDLGKNGYFFILDDKGVEMAHPLIEGKDISNLKTVDGKMLIGKELLAAAKRGGDYVFFPWVLPNDPDKYGDKITYVEQDKNWGWVVAAGSYLEDYNGGANNVLYMTLITLGISLFIGAMISWVFARRISKPILAISVAAEQVATGDLRIEDIQVKSRDEVGSLAAAFNQMIRNLRDLLRNIGISSEQVAASAEQLTASAEQSSLATTHIATTIQDVAEGSDRQMRSVTETVTMMHEMSSGVQQIASNAQSVSSSASRASDISQSGNQAVQTAVEQMQKISRTIDDLGLMIRGLGEQSNQIGNIVEVITGIAEQTNLLALNAAIEAARAGEQGRGFAVVADEVRKLAAQSSESAKQITELISSIQRETAKAVQSMDVGTKQFNEGIQTVTTAGHSFENIMRAVNDVANQIQEVSASTQQMSAGTEQVVQAVKTIELVAGESVASTQNVSAATEEQLATMDEIASASAALSTMAAELQMSISKFKI
jgi:methyl-accepting chemotaxis protein